MDALLRTPPSVRRPPRRPAWLDSPAAAAGAAAAHGRPSPASVMSEGSPPLKLDALLRSSTALRAPELDFLSPSAKRLLARKLLSEELPPSKAAAGSDDTLLSALLSRTPDGELSPREGEEGDVREVKAAGSSPDGRPLRLQQLLLGDEEEASMDGGRGSEPLSCRPLSPPARRTSPPPLTAALKTAAQALRVAVGLHTELCQSAMQSPTDSSLVHASEAAEQSLAHACHLLAAVRDECLAQLPRQVKKAEERAEDVGGAAKAASEVEAEEGGKEEEVRAAPPSAHTDPLNVHLNLAASQWSLDSLLADTRPMDALSALDGIATPSPLRSSHAARAAAASSFAGRTSALSSHAGDSLMRLLDSPLPADGRKWSDIRASLEAIAAPSDGATVSRPPPADLPSMTSSFASSGLPSAALHDSRLRLTALARDDDATSSLLRSPAMRTPTVTPLASQAEWQSLMLQLEAPLGSSTLHHRPSARRVPRMPSPMALAGSSHRRSMLSEIQELLDGI
eukprot:PLAT5842.1.p1 GENE.PLAT5842.1~~PLAT5842.1.p1  ORF type:complete len:510 (-),score=144.92 PLAT5842.1:39-1568(-)